MVLFCFLAIVMGVVAALVMDVVPFAIGMALVAVVGAGAALIAGLSAGVTLFSTLVLVIAAQVGYGLGLGLCALSSTTRSGRHDGAHRASSPGFLRSFRADKP